MRNRFIATVEQDWSITIPQPLLDQLGWKEGDELRFELRPNGVMLYKANHPDTESPIAPI